MVSGTAYSLSVLPRSAQPGGLGCPAGGPAESGSICGPPASAGLVQTQRHPEQVAGLTLIASWLNLTMDNPAVDAIEPHDP